MPRDEGNVSPPRTTGNNNNNQLGPPPSGAGRGQRASLVSTLRTLPSQRTFGQDANNTAASNSSIPPANNPGSPTSANTSKMSLHQVIVAAAAAAGLKLSAATPRGRSEEAPTAADAAPPSQPGSRSNRLLMASSAPSDQYHNEGPQSSSFFFEGPQSSAAVTEDNCRTPGRLWPSWSDFFASPALVSRIGDDQCSAYCLMFQEGDVPPPTDVDVLLHGIDHAALDALGITKVGHRIAILAQCRAAVVPSLPYSSPAVGRLALPQLEPQRKSRSSSSSSSSSSSASHGKKHKKKRTVRPHIYRAFHDTSSSSSYGSSTSRSSGDSAEDSDDTRAKRNLQRKRTQRTADLVIVNPTGEGPTSKRELGDSIDIAGKSDDASSHSRRVSQKSSVKAKEKKKSKKGPRVVITQPDGTVEDHHSSNNPIDDDDDSTEAPLLNPHSEGLFSVQNEGDRQTVRSNHTQSVFNPSEMRFNAPKSNYVSGGDFGLFPSDVVTQSIFTSRGRTPYTWIDLCGRDLKRIDFTACLRDIVQKYKFEEALLLDMDLTLALPQLITVPNEPDQFLIILRGAAAETSIREDSLHLLTSRLMIAVNRATRVVVSVHRRDNKFLVELRDEWHDEYAERSMSVLLCKLLDDTLISYVDAIHDSESLLDRYEARMLKQTMDSDNENFFVWLWRLLTGGIGLPSSMDDHGEEFDNIKRLRNREYADEMMAAQNFSRQKMNQLLYHLHRRCSVYSRMLTLTKTTLEETYAALHLASGDYAEQVGRSCSELAMKAESLHDNCQNLLNLHLSLVSFRTNELMNVLTVMSSIFEPLTFIVGVYGMNFINMPELELYYGYYYCLGFMLLIVFGVLLMFKRKGII